MAGPADILLKLVHAVSAAVPGCALIQKIDIDRVFKGAVLSNGFLRHVIMFTFRAYGEIE